MRMLPSNLVLLAFLCRQAGFSRTRDGHSRAGKIDILRRKSSCRRRRVSGVHLKWKSCLTLGYTYRPGSARVRSQPRSGKRSARREAQRSGESHGWHEGVVLSRVVALASLLAFAFMLAQAAAAATAPAAAVDAARVESATKEGANWVTTGRTYAEERFSPLTQINAGNVSRLGLAWFHDFGSTIGLESTPLVVDGVIYTTGVWNIIHALDAKTGRQLWEYDPKVPRYWMRYMCCGPANRGPAVWKGKVYAATIEGRLVAVDAATGKLAWEVQTTDPSQPYSITGAPRVVHGKVIIGNAGAEFGVRGYVTAYDAQTGKQDWRFYIVPGNPASGFESKTMEMAAKTWSGEWWKVGAGGTAWDAFAYDPELNLLYIGTGNGSPWSRKLRSPAAATTCS